MIDCLHTLKKDWSKRIIMLFILFFIASQLHSQTVSSVSVSPSGPYCEGDNITVTFTLSGLLTGLSIGTTFEIVNNTGATVFADVTPSPAPLYTTNGTYSVNLTIPYGGSVAGGNRRIRVTNYYWLVVTLSSDALSGSFTISPGSVGGTVSAPQTICSGTSPASLSLSGHTGSVVKWQKSSNAAFTSSTDIAGTSATLSSASIGALTGNTYFRAVVQNGSCPVAYAAPVLITVNSINPGVIQKGATNPGPGCAPLDPNVTGNTSSASGGGGTITYTWQQSTDGGTTWGTAAGTISGGGAQINPDPFTVTTRFRRVATSTLSGVTCSAYSNELIYQVYPVISLSTPTPNPPANTVCAGSSVTLNTILTGGTSPFNYQWVLNGSNVGPNAATFDLSGVTAADSGTYFVTVTDANGCTATVQRTINVITSRGGIVSSGTTVACNGSNSGTLNLSGYTGTILKWQYSTNGGTSWIDIANTTTAQSYVNLITTTMYRAVVQNTSCAVANSVAATITVPSIVTTGTITPTNVTCLGGSNGMIAISASGGTAPYSYSINNGSTYTAGTNPKTFTGLAAGSYMVKVKDNNGCESAATSVTISTSFPKPVGSIAGNIICEGQQATITFNATAGSSPFSLIINGITYTGVLSGTPFNISSPGSTTTYNLTKITDNNSCTNP